MSDLHSPLRAGCPGHRSGHWSAPDCVRSLPYNRPPVTRRPGLRLGAEELLRPGRLVVGHAGHVVDPLAPPAWAHIQRMLIGLPFAIT